MKSLPVFLSLLFLLIGAAKLSASSDTDQHPAQEKIIFRQEVENIFQKALDRYNSARHDLVESALRSLLEIYPTNHRVTGILYVLARAQFAQGKLIDAQSTLDTLIQFYPDSKYLDDAIYLQGAASFADGQYQKAAEKLFTVLETTGDPRLTDLAISRLPSLLLGYLNVQQVQQLRNNYQTTSSQQVFALMDAVRRYIGGEHDRAQTDLEALLVESFRPSFRDEVQRHIGMIESLAAGPLKIGVILPLTGFFEEEAKALLRGIQFALDESEVARELDVKMIVRDSQGEPLTTISVTRELVEQERVVGIIGEIESDKTAIIGAMAEDSKTAVLAPTAIESGLTAVSNNLFQMSPDVSVNGEKMAELAINELNLGSFAILAPADKYGRDITDGFAQKIDELNGSIVAEAWYYEGATDFREQLRRFRELGLRKMLTDSILQVMPELTRSQLDSIVNEINEMRRMKRQEEEQNRANKMDDSTATAVTSIDGIFMPVYTEQIPYVAPQLALYNIQTQLLGGNYWNDLDILIDNHQYVQGAIFSTDFFIDESEQTFLRFRDDFRLKMGVSPGRFELAGFDSMNLLLTALNESNHTRQDLLNRMMNIRSFQGLLGSYQFEQGSRMNTNLNMLQYQNNMIRKLE